jgi:hypothetical protein
LERFGTIYRRRDLELNGSARYSGTGYCFSDSCQFSVGAEANPDAVGFGVNFKSPYRGVVLEMVESVPEGQEL